MPARHRCLDWPQLEGLLELAPETAARRAIAACPRCQARLVVLAEFLNDPSTPAGAQPQAAALQLRRAFAAELAGSSQRPRRRAFGHRLLHSRLAWGMAAVIALALLGVASRERWFAPDPAELLRGEAVGERASLRLLTPVARADGSLRLSWRAQAGATSYGVQFFDAGLRPLAAFADRADTALVLAPGTLPAAPGSRVGWRVTAFAAGSALAVSDIGVLRLP